MPIQFSSVDCVHFNWPRLSFWGDGKALLWSRVELVPGTSARNCQLGMVSEQGGEGTGAGGGEEGGGGWIRVAWEPGKPAPA